MRQKILFKSVFCSSLQLKFRSGRGAYRHPDFMVLMLVNQGNEERRQVKDLLLLLQGFESFN